MAGDENRLIKFVRKAGSVVGVHLDSQEEVVEGMMSLKSGTYWQTHLIPYMRR